MTSAEIISLIVTIIGVFSFATIFTILYKSYATSQINEIKSGKKDIELIDEVIYERQEKIKKRKMVTKIVKSICFYLALLIIIPLFIFSLINRFQNNITMIGNKTIMVVASGSMSQKNDANNYLITNNLNNQFQTYDIIVLEKVENASDLNKYDIIAYHNDQGINVIHRIIEIEDGKYVTRGDANDASDKYHPTFNDVIGRYIGKKIPSIGIFIMFLQSYAGIITIISLIYCLIMIDKISNKINMAHKRRIEQLEDAIDYIDELEIEKIKAEYVETIYYKGYAYHFNESGFVEKTKIKDGPYLEKSNKTMIKEVINVKTSEKIAEEVVIKNDNQGE